MVTRYCKIALVLASFFFLFLVVFNNITDYGSNYAFVESVLSMNDTFEGNSAMWRAIKSPVIHHLFYWSIILWEAGSMALLGLGGLYLWKHRSASAAQFNRAKNFAIAGLTLSLLQWYIAFLSIGAEWFLMWQSKTFNGQGAAHRMFVVMGVTLIFLALKDDEKDA
jgi:predicted small integral membrane protein